jgi:hypothetical protein
MPEAKQETVFTFDLGTTNWRLYRVEYWVDSGDVRMLGDPQPSPLTSFINLRLPPNIQKHLFYDGGYRIKMLESMRLAWSVLDINESDVVIEVDVKNLGVDFNEYGVVCRSIRRYG